MIDVRTEGVLEAVLDREATRLGACGVTAAVRCDGLGAWKGAFGERAPGQPLDPDAVMPAYSTTKSITAICVVRLAELGALALDDPIGKWLPSLPFGQRVTIRQLLNHTAGVPNYSLDAAQIEAMAAHPKRAWSFDRFAEATCFGALDFEPGQGWAYSNTGYMLLKRVVEDASGTSFSAAIDQHVVGPLGHTHTGLIEDSLEPMTPGYSRRFSGGELDDVRATYDPGWCATGLIHSTAAELCEIYHALFGGKFVLRESLAQMCDTVRVPGDFPPAVSPAYGLGLMADSDSPFGPEFGHGGSGPGYDIRAACFPAFKDRRVSIAVMCNCDEIESAAIARSLEFALVDQLGETFSLS